MIARRVDDDDFEIVRTKPEVMVTSGGKSLIVGTMHLLTSNDQFEEPLSSHKIKGFGWRGTIVKKPDTGLPGFVEPFVFIRPDEVNASIINECIEVVADGGGMQINNPGGVVPIWQANGSENSHGYSIRPSLVIAAATPTFFVAGAAGSTPQSEDEGSLTTMPFNDSVDRFGIVVDVDTDRNSGFAVRLSVAVAAALQAIAELP